MFSNPRLMTIFKKMLDSIMEFSECVEYLRLVSSNDHAALQTFMFVEKVKGVLEDKQEEEVYHVYRKMFVQVREEMKDALLYYGAVETFGFHELAFRLE